MVLIHVEPSVPTPFRAFRAQFYKQKEILAHKYVVNNNIVVKAKLIFLWGLFCGWLWQAEPPANIDLNIWQHFLRTFEKDAKT